LKYDPKDDFVNGQWVEAGDIIGVMGSTGQSTGIHLHFTVYVDNKSVDPVTLFSDYN
jgi:murein DD-endopeptidase MepM/ murein hydrolase activator NlpD